MPKSPFHLFLYLAILTLTLAFHCDAQSPISVKDYAFERSYWHKQTLQTKPDELTVIYGRSDWFFYSSRLFIRRHSLSDNTTFEARIELMVNHQPAYLLNAFAYDTSIYLVCAASFTKKSDLGWCVLRYNNRTGHITTVIEPQSANALTQNVLLHGDVYALTSSDTTKAAVCFSWTGSTATMEKVYAIEFDLRKPQDFKTLALRTIDPITRYEHQQFLLDENGLLYSVGKQYIDGTGEVVNGHVNYAYVLMKGIESDFKLQCTLPFQSIVRSLSCYMKGDTLRGTALTSDTTLSLHDSLMVIQMKVSNGSVIYHRTIPFTNPPTISAIENRFENQLYLIDDKILSLFEQQHIEYNESAKAGNGFTYERGAAIATVVNKNGRVEKINNVIKHQEFDNMPIASLFPFIHNEVFYVAHINYPDDYTRSSTLDIINLNSGVDKKSMLSNVDWQKAEPYELFITPNGLVGFQSNSRRYTLFSVPIN